MLSFFKSLFVLAFGLLLSNAAFAQGQPVSLQPHKPVNWTVKQVIEPADLAALINGKTAALPVIFNIGVVEDIKGARNLGAAREEENITKLRAALKVLPKNTPVVVYCGCCPFDKCPNIRPAFQELISAGFTNGKVLNLPTNIKTDWISKGYPLAK